MDAARRAYFHSIAGAPAVYSKRKAGSIREKLPIISLDYRAHFSAAVFLPNRSAVNFFPLLSSRQFSGRVYSQSEGNVGIETNITIGTRTYEYVGIYIDSYSYYPSIFGLQFNNR